MHHATKDDKGVPLGVACISYVGEGDWYFLAHKLEQLNTFYFLAAVFHNDLIENFIFPPKIPNIFYVIIVFMQLSRSLNC